MIILRSCTIRHLAVSRRDSPEIPVVPFRVFAQYEIAYVVTEHVDPVGGDRAWRAGVCVHAQRVLGNRFVHPIRMDSWHCFSRRLTEDMSLGSD